MHFSNQSISLVLTSDALSTSVSVLLDGEEAQLDFIDIPSGEVNVIDTALAKAPAKDYFFNTCNFGFVKV